MEIIVQYYPITKECKNFCFSITRYAVRDFYSIGIWREKNKLNK